MRNDWFGLKTAGFWVAGAMMALSAAPLAQAQTAPDFTIEGPFLVTDVISEEAGLAINTTEPEVLFVTYDTINQEGFTDPITGEVPGFALIGRFFNTETFEPTSDLFIIFGNPAGSMETLDVRFNPVTQQYVVAGKADGRGTNGANVPLVAIVNPVSAGGNVVNAFAVEEDSDQGFDDVAMAVDSNNGNFLVVAERDFAETGGEGAVAWLFDAEGNLLTEEFTRIDATLQTADSWDVDDPDVDFLPNNNVFLYLHNTDSDTLPNTVTGIVIEPAPTADGALVFSNEQILSEDRIGSRQGHPAAIENPYTDELIGAFDYGNGDDGGDIFFFNVGDAPEYPLTASRDQIAYLEASGNDPINHRHPQLAADSGSGAIILAYNVNSSSTLPGELSDVRGMLFTILGADGQPLPGNGDELPGVGPAPTYLLDPEETGFIDNGANFHNVAYDAFTDSFFVVYATNEQFTRAARITINSDHSPESGIDNGLWMMY